MAEAPLKGIRVVDLGWLTAGAATSTLLLDLGADVVKVEGPGALDPFRNWVGAEDTERRGGEGEAREAGGSRSGSGSSSLVSSFFVRGAAGSGSDPGSSGSSSAPKPGNSDDQAAGSSAASTGSS